MGSPPIATVVVDGTGAVELLDELVVDAEVVESRAAGGYSFGKGAAGALPFSKKAHPGCGWKTVATSTYSASVSSEQMSP